MLGSIQMSGERLSSVDVKEICESLEAHNVRLLLMRECHLVDDHFNDVLTAVGRCNSIMQLNLNLGVVNSLVRAEMVGAALSANRSLQALFLHGSPIGDPGASLICRALASHPHVVSLDMGDCQLTDAALAHIVELLPPNGAKPGLKELTLSANPGISMHGWLRFFVAMSASSCLHCLSIEYNHIGDLGASCLAGMLAANRTLHTLDLEATEISETGGNLLLHLVRNYPTRLRQLCLAENQVKGQITSAIDLCLEESDSGHDDRSVSTETASGLGDGSSPEHYEHLPATSTAGTDSAAESGSDGFRLPPALPPTASVDRTGYKVALTSSQGVLSLRALGVHVFRASSVESDAMSSEQSSMTT